jgi:hypothetical protein
LATIATVALACGAVMVGCDDARKADKTVQKAVDDARVARLKGAEGIEEAKNLLSKAAGEIGDAGPATKAHAKAVLAHAELEAARARISDPTNGINQGNREIARLLWEIAQLGRQVQTSNNLAAAYKNFEPKEAIAASQQMVQAAQGGNAPNWIGDGPAAIPTLAAAQQTAQQLADQITQQQQKIQQLQQKQQQLAQQAEQLARQSEQQQGQPGLETFKQASALRKQSADVQNQIEVEQSNLARLQQDHAVAQARQEALAAAIEQFKKLADQINQGWQGVSKQAMTQQQLAAQILNGGGAGQNKNASIAAKAQQYAKQADETKKAYDDAEQALGDAVKHFEEAASAASSLGSSLSTSSANLPSDNEMKHAMDTLKNAYNPNGFKLSQADATLALAELQASRTAALAERQQVVAQLGPALKAAGLSLPKELDDAKLADELNAAAKQANENFDAAKELYQTVAEGGGVSDAVKNAGKAGQIYSLYGKSLLARATGNAKVGDDLLKQAKDQRDLVLQESKGALNALPAELVTITAGATTAPSATAPAAAPAATPAAAPAATPAAPAAAPAATSAAPAAAPAPAPGAPAAPATEGAAPAAPTAPAAPAAPGATAPAPQ